MCERCGGPTRGQNVFGGNHRHYPDCIEFLKRNQLPIKGVPDGMRIKEVMHLQTEGSTGIVYGQVILEKEAQG